MEIISTLLSYVLLYKYAALFALFFLASSGIPFPTVTIMIATAVFASQGYLDPWYAGLAMWFGSVTGDTVLYGVARRLRDRVFENRLFKKHHARLTEGKFAVFFDQHPSIVIIASRFLGFATIATNIISGIHRLSITRFLAADVLGEALVICMYSTLGYLLEAHWLELVPLIEQVGAIIMLIILIIALWKKRLRLQRAAKK